MSLRKGARASKPYQKKRFGESSRWKALASWRAEGPPPPSQLNPGRVRPRGRSTRSGQKKKGESKPTTERECLERRKDVLSIREGEVFFRSVAGIIRASERSKKGARKRGAPRGALRLKWRGCCAERGEVGVWGEVLRIETRSKPTVRPRLVASPRTARFWGECATGVIARAYGTPRASLKREAVRGGSALFAEGQRGCLRLFLGGGGGD